MTCLLLAALQLQCQISSSAAGQHFASENSAVSLQLLDNFLAQRNTAYGGKRDRSTDNSERATNQT
jgi:hypothetical protein